MRSISGGCVTLQQGEDERLAAPWATTPPPAPRRERPEPGFLAAIARSMGRVGTRLRQAVHREIARNALLARIDRKPPAAGGRRLDRRRRPAPATTPPLPRAAARPCSATPTARPPPTRRSCS
ncbi:MAG: hypothetical protein U1E14_07805 [Geminicoccaceae bacterium]